MSSTMLTLVAGICVIIGLGLTVAALRISGKTEGQQVLIKVTREAGRERVTVADASVFERLLKPLLALTLVLGKRITPAGQLAKLEQRLDHAGYPAGWDISRLLAIKALGLCFGLAVGFFIAMTLSFGFGVILMMAFGAAGFYAPDYWLVKTAQKRTAVMRKALADTVDMLNLTLAAGIGFDSALRLVATNNHGPLADEFSRVVQEIAIGKSRSEALRDLAARTSDDDLRRFCQTCVQAERRGTPFGEILSLQSRELRIKRRQDAEERAQKVPVKILFPMMVFVLPTLFIIVMGPAAVQIAQNMGGAS